MALKWWLRRAGSGPKDACMRAGARPHFRAMVVFRGQKESKEFKLASCNGFTLLEVMIAVTILASMSLLSATSIRTAVNNKAKLQRDIDTMSALRSAVRLIERDINFAFNYRDLTQSVLKKIEQDRAQRAEQNQGQGNNDQDDRNGEGDGDPNEDGGDGNEDDQADGSQQNNEPQPVPGIRELPIVTGFIGDKESLDFTSLNNLRTERNSKLSRQMEVGYYVAPCRRRTNPEKSTECLWRRISPILDGRIDSGGIARPILEDVKELKFRYIGTNQNDWVERWRAQELGNEQVPRVFPLAVEISLTTVQIVGETERPFTIRAIASIRNPNNQPYFQQNQNGQGQGLGQGQGQTGGNGFGGQGFGGGS